MPNYNAFLHSLLSAIVIHYPGCIHVILCCHKGQCNEDKDKIKIKIKYIFSLTLSNVSIRNIENKVSHPIRYPFNNITTQFCIFRSQY